jgi:ribosomal protein S27E
MHAAKPVKLSDEFAGYFLTIHCRQCRHTRAAEPEALARMAGWDVSLVKLATQLQCWSCGAKDCELTANCHLGPRTRDTR